jgi:peptidoglycan/xylan/chitin deacetylase (PgdA/CDA1 family)
MSHPDDGRRATRLSRRIDHWLPSPTLKASALFQGVGWPLLGLGEWAPEGLLETLLLNHALLAALGFWPQSRQLGPNRSRLPAEEARRGRVAITFDDGPDPEVTPRVLDLLESRGAKGTFFCIGRRAADAPALVREIAARGHGVENHSFDHGWNFALQSPARLCREVGRTQRVLAEITGRTPTLFRAPFGIRNPWMEPVVRSLGLELVSWSHRGYDAVSREPDRVERRLTRRLEAGSILLLHDGQGTRSRGGQAMVLEVLPAVLDALSRRGLSSVPLHSALAEQAAEGVG